ncbi:MAG: hypothetical protein H0T13_04425 [Actinobacteria bacterium]|nr:hypothetical protein [Actinomycetota bacterium]
MAEETVRIELAFDGGQSLSAIVTAGGADELERALGAGAEGTYALDASDGRYSVVLRRVVYLKRHARESRVGFGI